MAIYSPYGKYKGAGLSMLGAAAAPATVLLFHFDGVDGANPPYTNDGAFAVTQTAYNAADLATAQHAFVGDTACFGMDEDDPQGILFSPVSGNMLEANSDFTVEFWFRQNGPAQEQMVTFTGYKDAVAICAIVVSGYNSEVSLTMKTAAGTPFVTTIQTHDFAENAWIHVAASKSGATYRLFVDGVEKDEVIAANSDMAAWNAGCEFLSDPYYSGDDIFVDEFRLSNVARYTGNFTPATANFTAD